jgi:ParB-like nuclease domain
VRPLSNTTNGGGHGWKYQLVDGERRYRACKLIPLEDVPVEIREDIKTEEDAHELCSCCHEDPHTCSCKRAFWREVNL